MVRPKLADFLSALRLDISYDRAVGAYLFDEAGRAYLDMVGGFGAALLGHNHPELCQGLIEAVRAGVPSHAQASIGREPALLAAELNRAIGGDAKYYAVFTNTGSESIEAALKHAYLVHSKAIRRKYEQAHSLAVDLYATLSTSDGEFELPPGIFSLSDLRATLETKNQSTLESCFAHPMVAALCGSFHGKSSGSLKITHSERFRLPFQGLSAVDTRFIEPDRPEDLRALATEAQACFLYPSLADGKLTVREFKIARVMAFIFEPIQGEGGIRPLTERSLTALSRLHAELRIPFIIDEIQSGCGRTGAILAFRDTPLGGLDPEYITMGKALGGGLAKIGVTLVRKDVYEEDFGLLHSSTFAEDALSCRIARTTLALLSRQNGALLRQISVEGARLREKLEQLRERHAGLVADIRGKGLMLGIEIARVTGRSPFLTEASRQGVLSFLIASYILHHHRIRLMPALSDALPVESARQRACVLRLQPPKGVTAKEMDRVVAALDEALTIIDRNNEYLLLAHLWGETLTDEERCDPIAIPTDAAGSDATGPVNARVGFILHPPDIDRIVAYFMPSFAHRAWNRAAVSAWWRQACRFLDPVLVHRAHIHSRGQDMAADLVLVPMLPEDMLPSDSVNRREVAETVARAVRIAIRGCDGDPAPVIVGLGGYTSIVTACGQTLPDYNVPITTGNSFTVGLLLESIIRAANARKVQLEEATVAVVGACGNIGLALAENLAVKVGKLLLIGRPGEGGRLRLNYARRACAAEVMHALTRTGGPENGPKPDALAAKLQRNERAATTTPTLTGLTELLDIDVSTDIERIKAADIVVVATSSPDGELIRPHMLKHGAILCCASVPSNISPQLAYERSDCLVFTGGLACLPEQSRIDFIGLPADGLAWACLAETLFLGLDRVQRSVGKGRLKPADVQQCMVLGRRYGFTLGPLRPPALTVSEHWRNAVAECSEDGNVTALAAD